MEYINAVMVSWYSTKCHLQRRRRSLNIIQVNLVLYRVAMYYTVLTKGMKYKHSEIHLVSSLICFGAFATLRNVTVSLASSALPHGNNSDSEGWIFMKIDV